MPFFMILFFIIWFIVQDTKGTSRERAGGLMILGILLFLAIFFSFRVH